MIMSAILDALTSKEILTIIGVGAGATVVALINKYFRSKAYSGNTVSRTDLAISVLAYVVGICGLCGFSFSILRGLFKTVETMFFM